MLKEDPPANVVRKPSFHESEVVVQDHQAETDNQCNSGVCVETPSTDDCAAAAGSILCDPAEVFGQIFTFGRNKREES